MASVPAEGKPKRSRGWLSAAALALLVAILAPLAAGGSCANVLAIDRVMYSLSWFNNEATFGRPLADADLGPVYRLVKENRKSWSRKQSRFGGFLDQSSASCGPRDNYSTDLPRRTPLHAVRGYDPTFRLAARLQDGVILLYDVDYDPTARTGGDLLDIDDRVVAIRLITREDETLVEIDDAATVDRLVEVALAAPIEETDLRAREEWPLTVIYVLDDGTVATDSWYQSTGELSSGIQAPEAYSDILRDALSAAGTPLPGTPEP